MDAAYVKVSHISSRTRRWICCQTLLLWIGTRCRKRKWSDWLVSLKKLDLIWDQTWGDYVCVDFVKLFCSKICRERRKMCFSATLLGVGENSPTLYFLHRIAYGLKITFFKPLWKWHRTYPLTSLLFTRELSPSMSSHSFFRVASRPQFL